MQPTSAQLPSLTTVLLKNLLTYVAAEVTQTAPLLSEDLRSKLAAKPGCDPYDAGTQQQQAARLGNRCRLRLEQRKR